MKLITYDDICSLSVPPSICYDWAEEMIREKEEVLLPTKISLKQEAGVFVNVMPCIIPGKLEGKVGGVKIVTRYPDRSPSLDGKVLLMNVDNGEFLALLDANWITTMRTGAVAAHTIMMLAKRDYCTIAMLGLGNTARATLLVLVEKNPQKVFFIKLLRYKGQEYSFAERFAGYPNLHFSYVDTPEELVKKSDVVISCVTYFDDNLCDDDCFDEGVLVVPIHTKGFMNCDLFFDKVYADDYVHVKHFSNFDRFRYFAEVSDVVNQKALGRESERERILAYNIGVSMHDINFAAHIYQMIDKECLVDIDMHEPKEKFWI